MGAKAGEPASRGPGGLLEGEEKEDGRSGSGSDRGGAAQGSKQVDSGKCLPLGKKQPDIQTGGTDEPDESELEQFVKTMKVLCIRGSGTGLESHLNDAALKGLLPALQKYQCPYRLAAGFPTPSMGFLHRACLARSAKAVRILLEFGF